MYSQTIQQAFPGLIIFLIDQSASMADPFTRELSKAEYAATAINACISELLISCSAGGDFKDQVPNPRNRVWRQGRQYSRGWLA